MQSNEYKIERWDVIYNDKLNLKQPLVYIVPDQTLIEFAKINKDTLYGTIRGTGNNCYDNKVKVSLVSIKESRPNLFDKTGYYTLQLLDTAWIGYPKSLGSVSFEGVNKQVEPYEIIRVEPQNETENENDEPQNETENQSTIEKFMDLKNNKPNVIIIILGLLLLLVLAIRFIPRN